MEPNIFRDRLAGTMVSRGITQADLVRACESIAPNITINRSDISRYLSGQSTPRRKKLEALAKALDVSYSWLSGEAALEYAPEVTDALKCLCDATDGHDAYIYVPDEGDTYIVYVSPAKEGTADIALSLFGAVGDVLADTDSAELLRRASVAISDGGVECEMIGRILGLNVAPSKGKQGK